MPDKIFTAFLFWRERVAIGKGDAAMDAEQGQKKGGLDELAARLDARYKQELKAREVLEKIKQMPPLDANATWREITMWKALETSALETGADRITKEDLDTFFGIEAYTDERELAKKYARRTAPFGSGGINPVLLYLLAAGVFAMDTDTDFFTALMTLPVLAIFVGGALCIVALVFAVICD